MKIYTLGMVESELKVMSEAIDLVLYSHQADALTQSKLALLEGIKDAVNAALLGKDKEP